MISILTGGICRFYRHATIDLFYVMKVHIKCFFFSVSSVSLLNRSIFSMHKSFMTS